MRPALLAAAPLLAFALAAPAAEPPPNKALAALFEREFRLALQESPEDATFLGYEEFNDRLTDRSPGATARRKAHVKAVIAELARFDPAKLATQERISRDVMLDQLKRIDEENAIYGALPFEAGLEAYLLVSPMNGPHDTLAALMRAAPFRNARDYEMYLARLAAVPRSLEQVTAQLREAMRSGWMPPRDALAKVPAQFDVFASVDPALSPLWKPFSDFPASVPEAARQRLAEQGRQVLSQKVDPAFAAMKRFLETEYIPAARQELAASRLPGGDAYYALRVRAQTTTPLTPLEIHELGKREVARIRGEMERLMASTGFKGTLAEFLQFLRTDPRFFFKTSEERLTFYRDIGKRADAELPKLFATLPRVPYGVRAMEAYEGANADHYSPPPLDGSRAGFFEANVNHVDKQPNYEMTSVLLHEAVPGHHLQNARARELDGLPLFRRSLWYVAYGEGWALYAESLGYEMGMYKDPYQHFGALTGEMLRACRLVIDTGLHAFGWGREQSIRYLVENSGVHPDFAAAEVDRYIVWPGQALGYKIGELRIKALRAKAAAALGERFDVRRFHNAVLDDGALPLTVLESRIDEWIGAEKRRRPPANSP
jgi:uncharacterized protein (DUF885 family)